MKCLKCGCEIKGLKCSGCDFDIRSSSLVSIAALTSKDLEAISDFYSPKPALHKMPNDCLYFGILIDGKKEGYGVLKRADNSVIYEGDYRNDVMSGRGTYYFQDGTKYIGEFFNNTFNGFGCYEWPNKARYEGPYKDGKRHGHHGVYMWSDGQKYDGDWEYDKRVGHGIMRYINGDYYDGEWKDGEETGRGTKHYVDGGVYDGNWSHGKRDGHGIMHYADGSTYDGYWEADVESGENGEKHYPNGDVYKGSWKNGTYDGEGKMIWVNNLENSPIIYEGQWQKGRRSGKGIECHYCLAGSDSGTPSYQLIRRYVGVWEDDILLRGRVYDHDNYLIYDGEFDHYEYNGNGTLYRPDGRYFVCRFAKSIPEGHGTEYNADHTVRFEGDFKGDEGKNVVYTNGMRYTGTMKNGHREGQGSTIYPDGTIETGKYQRDLFKGGSKGTTKNDSSRTEQNRTVEKERSKDGQTGKHIRKRIIPDKTDAKDPQQHGFTPEVPSFMKKKADDTPAPSLHTCTDGSTFFGIIVNGRAEGKGTQVWKNGAKYEGWFQHGYLEGSGVMTFEDGSCYIGQWKGGKRCGQGKLKYSDGGFYDGMWRDDKRNGIGKMIYADGEVYDGEWKDDGWGQGTLITKKCKVTRDWSSEELNGSVSVEYTAGLRKGLTVECTYLDGKVKKTTVKDEEGNIITSWGKKMPSIETMTRTAEDEFKVLNKRKI